MVNQELTILLHQPHSTGSEPPSIGRGSRSPTSALLQTLLVGRFGSPKIDKQEKSRCPSSSTSPLEDLGIISPCPRWTRRQAQLQVDQLLEEYCAERAGHPRKSTDVVLLCDKATRAKGVVCVEG